MIKKVLITSGGTSEPIDSIRSITNKGTGQLGALTAEEFAKSETVETIYYLHAKGAILPDCDKVVPIEVVTVEDLLAATEDLLSSTQIDAVIHAMAVSDYRVAAVSTADAVYEAAKNAPDAETFSAAISESTLNKETKKISSSLSAPVLLLEQTPKILPLFRKRLPEATIVGFKLLSGSTSENLIDVAYELLLKNGCNYVFANDYSSIKEGEHKGYLINYGRFVFPATGKEAIAKLIAKTVLS